ncbi:hypothetical protein Btru_075455 [Bulinus truncatus]|nr:hypothetical protein Btru_075455 [Bulinus truncatus]
MATYFGEVLPVSSRAVDDDEEEDELQQPLPNPFIQWSTSMQEEIKKSKDALAPCSRFLLAYGIEANAFVEIYLTKQLKFERIGGIFTSVPATDGLLNSKDLPGDKTCFLYKDVSDPSVLLCLCKRDVLPEESYTWAKLLTDTISFSQAVVTVLAASSTGSYCSETPSSHLETPFLRYLKTDSYDSQLVCPALEQPNMLTGFPAMLMTFFQVLKYKAVVYVCYKENRFMDITDVKAFLPVLTTLPFRNLVSSRTTEKLLLDLIEQRTVHDMIYM